MLLGGAALLSSCSNDRDSNPNLVQPTEFVLNETNWRDATVALENTKDSLILSWSAPQYATSNAPVVVTYTVDFSPKGTFTKAYDATAEDNSTADYITMGTATTKSTLKFGAEELNRVYMQFYGWKSDSEIPASVKGTFRVNASVLTATNEALNGIASNEVNISVRPYFMLLKNADPEIWYLIGSDIADGSWGSDIGKSIIPLQTIEGEKYDATTGQGKIQWIGYLAGGGFKLKQYPDSWDFQWGQGDSFGEYKKNDGGSGNITVPTPGLYTVTLETDKDKLTVEAYPNTPNVFAGMAIAGSFNSWGDEAMNACNTAAENHDWYLEYTFKAGDEVKIKQAGSWDFNRGGKLVELEDGYYAYGVGGGDNFFIAEDGTYLILFNDITGFVRFIKK